MSLISYTEQCLRKDKIIRWPDHAMPLKIYIAPFRWYKEKTSAYHYHSMVENAMNIWQQNTGGKISFVKVKSLYESQINVDWKRVDRNALGHCYFSFDDAGRLYSADVQIGLSDGLMHSQYQDKGEVLHTIIHELGHALGLGHSPYKNDIMYVPHQYGVTRVSKRDINTLKWLYKFPYGLKRAELLAKYSANSLFNIDKLIYKLENNDSDIEGINNSLDPEKLDSDQELLAKLNMHNLSWQNINIPKDKLDYMKNRDVKDLYKPDDV